ncbi:hypothetical protein [Planococcus versutus]|uniref:Uncharacterized protein n=1 Tax=Planococcus versutus TaxID=1302659 RepID=A0A1B1S4R6_9BACL|nr:hypothetical protein [Planococcus versutus]ANU28178.1 hypothetical protein I858_014395 [Planococcus versutus]
MKNQHLTALERFNAIDQMINEGLGSGSINPSYTEAHLRLKEKQEEQLRAALQQQQPPEEMNTM